MQTLISDLRYALRGIRRSPGFALLIVLTLGLGIGANTAIFSVIRGVILQPLPFPAPGALMQVQTVFQSNARGNVSYPDFADLRARNRTFSDLAVYATWTTSAIMGERGARVTASMASSNLFSVLGIHPVRGRLLAPEDERTGVRVANVSYGFWRSRLGGEPLANQTISIGGDVYQVIGVLAAGDEFPIGSDIWVPRQAATESRTAQNWHVVGRLRAGATRADAQRDLTVIAGQIRQEYGDNTYMTGAAVRPVLDQFVGDVRPQLWLLLAAAALLLLVACANVANLLLARAMSRRRDVALSLALGAHGSRIVRRFLTESLLLALGGAGGGIVLAMLGIPALLALDPGRVPRTGNIGVDWVVLVFALAVALLTAVGIGLVPALRMLRGDPREALASGQRTAGPGASGRRIRGALVTSQVALTMVLLIGAGLLGRSFLALLSVNPGFRTHGGIVADLWFPEPRDSASATRLSASLTRLLGLVRAIPGVERAGGINDLPLEGGNSANGTFLILQSPDEVTDFEGFGRLVHNPDRTGNAEYRVASPGYFRAMDIPLIRGRLFDERDAPGTPHVAVISAALARSRWPHEDPIGKIIEFGNMDGDLRPMTIVGVVGDVRERGLGAEPQPTLYANCLQRPSTAAAFHLVVQGSLDPPALTAAVRNVVQRIGPQVPMRAATLDGIVAASLGDRRFVLFLLGLFGGFAALLATMGVYGVMAYTASERVPEIGVRMALGARRSDVVRLFVRQGIVYAVAGIAAGLVAALLLTRFLASMLYGVRATDPTSFVAIAALLSAVAVGASWLPARRATGIDPMKALRED